MASGLHSLNWFWLIYGVYWNVTIWTAFTCESALSYLGADDDDACSPFAALNYEGWNITFNTYTISIMVLALLPLVPSVDISEKANKAVMLIMSLIWVLDSIITGIMMVSKESNHSTLNIPAWVWYNAYIPMGILLVLCAYEGVTDRSKYTPVPSAEVP